MNDIWGVNGNAIKRFLPTNSQSPSTRTYPAYNLYVTAKDVIHNLTPDIPMNFTTSAGVTCDCSGNLYAAQMPIRIPYLLSVLHTRIVSPPGKCTQAGELFGIQIGIDYQVVDQLYQPFKVSGLVPQERIIDVVINGTPYGDPLKNWGDFAGTTDANGQFTDSPFGTCIDRGFLQTSKQPIRIVKDGVQYIVRINNWTEASSAPGTGIVTNKGDISVQR